MNVDVTTKHKFKKLDEGRNNSRFATPSEAPQRRIIYSDGALKVPRTMSLAVGGCGISIPEAAGDGYDIDAETIGNATELWTRWQKMLQGRV